MGSEKCHCPLVSSFLLEHHLRKSGRSYGPPSRKTMIIMKKLIEKTRD